MQSPTPGRTVNYVMKDGQIRPLVIVHVFPSNDPDTQMVNGHLLLDGSNDRHNNPAREPKEGEHDPLIQWATSVHHDHGKAVGTWHWPNR